MPTVTYSLYPAHYSKIPAYVTVSYGVIHHQCLCSKLGLAKYHSSDLASAVALAYLYIKYTLRCIYDSRIPSGNKVISPF